MKVSLTMTEAQRRALAAHLFPTDGCEAVAFAICGRASSPQRHRLLVRRIEPVAYDTCSVRTHDRVTWPTSVLVPWIEEAAKFGGALIKVHGHRGYRQFSSIDDQSDSTLFPSLYNWTQSVAPLASAIMMDDGEVFGRVVNEAGAFAPLDSVNVIGDDLSFYPSRTPGESVPEFGRRIAQMFGKGTFDQLRHLRIAVIGASGTGSVVIEQLARNAVGSLVLVDPDHVEEKNLNRIVNATMDDAMTCRPKVDVAARSIKAMALGTNVELYAKSLFDPEVVRAVASCDIVFGCMDTIDGRYLLNKLATFYLIPYFDLGVKIEADGVGGVQQVVGSVHYLKPDGASLISRNVITMEQVRSAGLKRTDATRYRKEIEEGYIRGVPEDRPAVIQLNSLIASLAINELLARLHPYRLDPNATFSVTRVSLSHGIWDAEEEGAPCRILARHAGRGDVNPLLDMAELSVRPLS